MQCLLLTQGGQQICHHASNASFGGKAMSRGMLRSAKRGFQSKAWPRVVHRLHHSCVRACTPFFKMFVCPLAESLDHRII